jgi:restriction endonuclease Mrr
MEYIDFYTFGCDSCGFSETIDKFAGREMGEIEETHCPYCGHVWHEHRHHHSNQAATPSSQEEIYRHPAFDKVCPLIIPAFEQTHLELFDYFAKHPDHLHQLDWRKFEELLESIFRNQGFTTELGPGRGDGGVDIRLLQKDSIGPLITCVQAKRYRPDYPIGLEAVAAFYAVIEDQRANRGLFVTTSRYLPSARRFAERKS